MFKFKSKYNILRDQTKSFKLYGRMFIRQGFNEKIENIKFRYRNWSCDKKYTIFKSSTFYKFYTKCNEMLTIVYYWLA